MEIFEVFSAETNIQLNNYRKLIDNNLITDCQFSRKNVKDLLVFASHM